MLCWSPSNMVFNHQLGHGTNTSKRRTQTYARLFQAILRCICVRIFRGCIPNNPLPPHQSLAIIPSLNPLPLVTFSLSRDMGDQSGSAHFQTLFDSALQAYEKKTGVSLAKHVLATQLQDCHSVESITMLIQHQAKDLSDFRGKSRIMNLIQNTVSILSTLSANSALGGSIGLVRQDALGCSMSLITF